MGEDDVRKPSSASVESLQPEDNVRKVSMVQEFVEAATDPVVMNELTLLPAAGMAVDGPQSVAALQRNKGWMSKSARSFKNRKGLLKTISERGKQIQKSKIDRKLEVNHGLAGPGEAKASIFSMLFFNWLNPLIELASTRPLQMGNLWKAPDRSRAEGLMEKFDIEWAKELAKPKQKRQLAWAFARLFKWQLFWTGVGSFVQQMIMLVTPLLVQQLLKWFQDPAAYSGVARGYIIAVSLFVVGFFGNGIVGNQMFHILYTTGMNGRTALNATIYRKSLLLSNKARQKTSTGECVTLMSNDSQRLPDAMITIHSIWTTPLFIAVAVYFLVRTVGVSAIAGLAFLIFMMPLQAKIAMTQMKVQRGQMALTDARLKLVNEVIQGIKIVKYYAWEAPFEERISALRAIELASIRKFSFASTYSLVCLMSTPFAMVLITLCVYFSTEGDFAPDKVFTAVSLLLVIRFPLFMLPMTIASIVQLRISFGRLQRFFELDEIDNTGRNWIHKDGTPDGSAGSMTVTDGKFTWNPDKTPEETDEEVRLAAAKAKAAGRVAKAEEKAAAKMHKKGKGGAVVTEEMMAQEVSDALAAVALAEEAASKVVKFETTVNFTIQPGQLVAVVGQVGSGKSSLVSAVLGEMTRLTGQVNIDGSVAYVAQMAWIFNATLQANILMGRPLDQAKYNKVLDACALVEDLAILPAGDLTEIGEKGINLSGGQKQRVSLARAAYADADIYIFDDPLSAVDAHVARHLFTHCINGLLKNKTRIFCTNQLQFLEDCDRVLVVQLGTVVEDGTYSDLLKVEDGELANLMSTFHGGEEELDDEEEAPAPELKQITNGTSTTENGVSNGIANGSSHHGVASESELVPRDRAVSEGPSRRRTRSQSTMKAADLEVRKGNEVGAQLVEAEGMEVGKVNMRVYHTYFIEGSGGWALPLWLIFATVTTQALSNLFEVWLSIWSNAYLDDGKAPNYLRNVYILLGLMIVLAYLVRGLSFAIQALRSSKTLHNNLVRGIMSAPMSFFDGTPMGRILNRFSKDMDAIDMQLPRNIPMFLMTVATLSGVLITISVMLPWFVVPLLPLLIVYYRVQRHYRPTSRDLQRLESMSRSPIFAQFSETLAGVSTLRAFNKQLTFINQNVGRLDNSSACYYHMMACNRWLQCRLELLGNLILFVAAILIVIGRSASWTNITAGAAGLVLTYTQQITGNLNWAVRMGCETEARITSAERVHEYSTLTPEAAPVNPDYQPPANWPSRGTIVFKGICLKYRPHLPLVLKNVNLSIKGGEKIGIAGRTGSGKSSLMTVLFRIVEPCAGTIEIDGVDACRLGLRDLRSAISIIPQDPVMFCGSLRQNLDPFELYSDDAIWDALRAVHLGPFITGLEGQLTAVISEGGENLSVGQRQLICLARAILRRNKILVCDEATANIDIDTDALIQVALREQFKNCTVLTIAHRLNTIMDCDRILVMKDGMVGEFDTPARLVASLPLAGEREDTVGELQPSEAPSKGLLMEFLIQTGKSSSRKLLRDISQREMSLREAQLAEMLELETHTSGTHHENGHANGYGNGHSNGTANGANGHVRELDGIEFEEPSEDN